MSAITPLYKNPELICVIVSDTHIDIKHPFPFLPMFHLKRALSDSQGCRPRADAFIIVGDITSRGSEDNWALTRECFEKYNPAKNLLLAIGNHDGWGDDSYDAVIRRFCRNMEQITGMTRAKPWFSQYVNGYPFIFLGSDDDSGCEASLSDEQVEWFAKEMETASETGKPIFVFCHQSLNGKHGLPLTWDKDYTPDQDPMDGGLGERSDEIEAIIKKYRNVYYFSGHSHMGLCGENSKAENGFASIEQEEETVLVNFPSLACGNHHGENNEFGVGVVLEVYGDRVVIRPRSVLKHRWVTSVNMKDAKPYFEKLL